MVELTLAGPAKNALGTEMMTSIVERLRAAAGQPVLITGEGDAFSAGLNLKELSSLDGDRMLAFLKLLERCMTALYLHDGPTVALVNGHAIAGGCVLTLCCDRRLMIENPKSKIGLNEVALGVRFPPRILEIVRRRVPAQHLDEVVLGAGLFSPTDALRLGLVDEVIDDPQVARARLSSLAAHPRDVYAITKKDLRGDEQSLCRDDVWNERLAAGVATWTSHDVRTKIAAVLKK